MDAETTYVDPKNNTAANSLLSDSIIASRLKNLQILSDNFKDQFQAAQKEVSDFGQNIDKLSEYVEFIEVDGEQVKITEFGTIFNKTFSSTIHKIIESAKHSMEMIFAMQEVAKSLAEVESFITKIQRITYMANMLAMNAAIEANKAGELGKGFNIVANEVRDVSSEISSITSNMGLAVKKIARDLSTANAVVEKVAVIDLSEEIFSKDRIDLMLEAFVVRNLKLKTEIGQIFGHKYEGRIILDRFIPIQRRLEEELALLSNNIASSKMEKQDAVQS